MAKPAAVTNGVIGPVPGPRHLNFENLDTYWARRVAVEVPVPGQPVCRLHLDPGRDEISLLTPLVGEVPNVARFQNIELNTLGDDKTWAELRIAVAGSLHGAYGILATVADRMQIWNESLAVAVPRAIAEYRGVLTGRVCLSLEQEIGLFGELLALESLLQNRDDTKAIEAWVGPLAEEHDFAFANVHVEVKTTSAERRRHWIGPLRQLEPLRKIPLWLLSIQITRSSGTGGRTLADLIRDVRAISGDSVVLLDERLAKAGWDDDLRDLFTEVWTARSAPRCYRIDESFPALTENRLAQVVPRWSLLSDVSYRVDVTDLDFSDAPVQLSAFVDPGEGKR